jgi:thymidine kinase
LNVKIIHWKYEIEKMKTAKKVYFKYGVMGSSKSFDLIRAEFNYRERGMDTFVITPAIDTRNDGVIKSRVGVSVDAYVIAKDGNIYELLKEEVQRNKREIKALFVDEVHLFTADQIDSLTNIADELYITVICYGLRTDFKSKMFPGSKRLLEVADEIEEIKAMCDCGRKATYNARFINGKHVLGGRQIHIGDEEYKSFCRKCYKNLSANL